MSKVMKIAIGAGVALAVLWYLGQRNAPARVAAGAGPAGEANNTVGLIGAVSGGLAQIISGFRSGPVQG